MFASPKPATEPYRLLVEIPSLPGMNTSSTRRHWGVHHREARQWRTLVVALIGRRRPPRPLARARVTLTRLSSREPDFDNLAFSFKPIVDALVRAGVLVDDGPEHVERVYLWDSAPRNRGRVTLLVEELT